MPSTARVLAFPLKTVAPTILSRDEVSIAAAAYLNVQSGSRDSASVQDCISEPDVLLSVLLLLKERADSHPELVTKEASTLYQAVNEAKVGLFDEKHYFAGEAALIAGGALRLLGRRDEASLWFERADSAFRQTINGAPSLAKVSYARLTMHYDAGSYERVLEFAPSLLSSFAALRMHEETLKCVFLEASALKACGRLMDAQQKLEQLKTDDRIEAAPSLHHLVLVTLGETYAANGKSAEALSLYQEALALQSMSDQPLAMAHLKGVVAEALRRQGALPAAVDAYRSAIHEYVRLGMATMEAYLRVIVAETLIAASRFREAEWEILAALPTIEEQKMVPEGFAAVALLKESVRQRNADPNALRELREHLQANQK